MRKIVDYYVIQAETGEDLTLLVCNMISQGWRPIGGIACMDHGMSGQIMVTHEEEPDFITGEPVVALPFDGGPDEGKTISLLRQLETRCVSRHNTLTAYGNNEGSKMVKRCLLELRKVIAEIEDNED